jgi:choline dehydrogenase-like flavoprotein
MSRQLSSAQHRTIAALAEAIAPSCAQLPVGAAQVDVAGQLDALLARLAPTSGRMIRLLTSVLGVAPLAAGYRHGFGDLPPARRQPYLERALGRPGWDHGVALTLRALCLMVFAGDPRFRKLVGDTNEPFKTGLPIPPPTELPVFQHPELGSGTTVDCDVVIVGSGAGGATVARELAQSGINVAVVEEGGPVTRQDFDGRALDRTVKYYRNNGFTSTFGGSLIPVPMGCVVGGTTVVNSGTLLRAPDSVLDEWAGSHGAELAAPERMGPQYDALDDQLAVQPVTDDIMGRNGELVRRGAEALGLAPHAIPRPTRGCAGSGQCGFGCPRDAKQAMHLTHLPAAVRRGARIYARCRVERILLRGRRAAGVEARILDAAGTPTGHTLTVRARAVFLCAGALMTPLLLARHGLGKSSRAVGNHLRIHPGNGITGRFSEVVRAWQGVMQSVAIDEGLDEGFLLEATFPPLGMSYSAAALPGIGEEHAERLAAYPHMASIGSIVSDTSSGRVRRLPGLGATMLYRMNAEDVRRSIRATALAARVLFAAGATEVYPGLPALPVLRSVAEAEALEQGRWRAKDLKMSAYHPMGTARMGADGSRAVCDPAGRVHDAEGVFVADTSLFPGSTHVNPQFTLMALTRNIADRFIEQWPATARRS